jgi:hypothetical protein
MFEGDLDTGDEFAHDKLETGGSPEEEDQDEAGAEGPGDARERAAGCGACGANGIVSNHGGRAEDTGHATIECLPEDVDACPVAVRQCGTPTIAQDYSIVDCVAGRGDWRLAFESTRQLRV